MGDEDLVGKVGHQVVALGCERRCGSAASGWEGRQDQQSVFIQGGLPVAWDSHVVDAACGADYHWLAAAQQQAKALLLHRCLKAANDRDPRVAHGPGEVVGLEDEVSRAALRTEEGGQPLFE